MEIMPEHSCGAVADKIINLIECGIEYKQEILETFHELQRAQRAAVLLKKAVEVLDIEQDIRRKVKMAMDKNQREYYLREQMKVIEEELGGKDGIGAEADRYRKEIEALELPEYAKEKLLREVDRLVKYGDHASESGVIRTYLDTVLELPWNQETAEEDNIEAAQEILDRDHYGLEQVKERVIEYLSVRHFNRKAASILCLVGPPGVGKTSIAKSIAQALNKKYVRISLGGIHDEADIRGHRRTYIGSMPGRIMAAVAQAGTKNPLILLDEVDKLGGDYKGDPSAALLEVLDAEQNDTFRDHFVEVPFDLSQVLFITTANDVGMIPAPLLDRMELIELSSYTREEKFHIAKEHLVQIGRAHV